MQHHCHAAVIDPFQVQGLPDRPSLCWLPPENQRDRAAWWDCMHVRAVWTWLQLKPLLGRYAI